MSGHQQLDKLKGHALIFSDEVRDLILGFQMLVPIAQDEQLLKRFPAPTSARYANCAWLSHWGMHIGITKLTYDSGSQNPTAGRPGPASYPRFSLINH
jgi:hypothetical protein